MRQKQIKVAHLITGLDTGGAETMLAKLVLGMDRARFENVVLSMDLAETPISRLIEDNGVKVIRLGIRPARRAPLGFISLFRTLLREKPDVIQTWLYHADLTGLLMSKISYRSPLLWNLRCSNLAPEDHSRSLFWIIKILSKLSAQPETVVVNSEFGRKAHEDIGYRPRAWEVIPNGFDTEVFKPSEDARKYLNGILKLGNDKKIIGLVARYHPMKDHATFLLAAGKLRKSRDDVHFVLVGSGVNSNNREIARLIQQEGIIDCVSLLGERADIPSIIAGFDLSTCSSYSEGFPNVVGESMSCAVPCVVTDTGDMREIIGPYGEVVAIREPVAMAQAWDKLLSMEPSKLKEMGQAARQRVQSLYSIDAIISRYEKLYKKIAG